MAANMKDVKKFYTMLRPNIYPKNGSWKDAEVMKNVVSAYVITWGLLMVVMQGGTLL